MQIIDFIQKYWTQILFVVGVVSTIYKLFKLQQEATKCSLRNDILSIYDYCKRDKKISVYQKQAVHISADLYDKNHGNSFVKTIVEEMDTWDVID